MGISGSTAHFRTYHAMRSIFLLCDDIFLNRLGKARPPATRIELVGRNKQRLSGGNININAWAMLIPVFIVEGRFGGILLGYCILFRRQFLAEG